MHTTFSPRSPHGAQPAHRGCLDLFATRKERGSLAVNVRSYAAYVGSVVFWLGMWTLIDVDSRVTPNTQRHLAYIGVGILCLVLTDSLYACGGLEGSLAPRPGARCQVPCRHSLDGACNKLLLLPKLMVSLTGNIMFWLGAGNLMDENVPPHASDWPPGFLHPDGVPATATAGAGLAKAFSAIAAGIALLIATGTLFPVSGVVNIEEEAVDYTYPASAHLRLGLRAIASIFGQSMVFYGFYYVTALCFAGGALCTDENEVFWKVLFTIAMGMILQVFTESFIADEDEDEGSHKPFVPSAVNYGELQGFQFRKDGERGAGYYQVGALAVENGGAINAASRGQGADEDVRLTAMSYARAIVAVFGGVTHNLGLWQLFDVIVGAGWRSCSTYPFDEVPGGNEPTLGYPACYLRDGGYAAVGMFLLTITGSVLTEAGINPSMLQTVDIDGARARQARKLRQKWMRRNAILGRPRTHSDPDANAGSRRAKRSQTHDRKGLKDRLIEPQTPRDDFLAGLHPSMRPKGYVPGVQEIAEDEPDDEDMPRGRMRARSLETPRTMNTVKADLATPGGTRVGMAANADFVVGQRVEANWNNFGDFYHGVVANVQPNGLYTIRYDDEDVEKDVPRDRMRKGLAGWDGEEQDIQAPRAFEAPEVYRSASGKFISDLH